MAASVPRSSPECTHAGSNILAPFCRGLIYTTNELCEAIENTGLWDFEGYTKRSKRSDCMRDRA